MQVCTHPRLCSNDPRRDYCPDCGYEFYYGDAHAADPEARISRLVSAGRDGPENGIYPPEKPHCSGDLYCDCPACEKARRQRLDDEERHGRSQDDW